MIVLWNDCHYLEYENLSTTLNIWNTNIEPSNIWTEETTMKSKLMLIQWINKLKQTIVSLLNLNSMNKISITYNMLAFFIWSIWSDFCFKHQPI